MSWNPWRDLLAALQAAIDALERLLVLTLVIFIVVVVLLAYAKLI